MRGMSISRLLVVLSLLALQSHCVSAKLGGSNKKEEQENKDRVSVTAKTTREEARNVEEEAADLPRLHLRETDKDLRDLQDLTYYGGQPDSEHIPLGLCEGDCDEDSDVSSERRV